MHSKCLFDKRGGVPKNSFSESTSYFYDERIVFSPQQGKMNFTDGMIEEMQLSYAAL